MWPARYFNPRYWASRYWPKVGDSPVVDPHIVTVMSWNLSDSETTWSVRDTTIVTYENA